MKPWRILVCSGLLLIFAAVLFAQDKPVPAAEAIKQVGEVKTVYGVVVSAKYSTATRGKPTFLNLDEPYPNQVFTVLIWGSDRSKFAERPETYYKGKVIYVTGLVETYRGAAEIIVRNPSQISETSPGDTGWI